MKIIDIINNFKSYCYGFDSNGVKIDDNKTRDKVLYGNPDVECTGIILTCYPTVNVIKHAIKNNVNFIICHEALFWNHGDHQDWLIENNNQTYNKKIELLEEGKIVVWRNHDYIHSGIPDDDGNYVDGIFAGIMNKLEWNEFLIEKNKKPNKFCVNNKTVEEIAYHIIDKLNLNGLKIIGNKKSLVNKIWLCGHIIGNNNDQITKIDKEMVNLIIPHECIDYTTSEYMNDSSQLGFDKAIIMVGHFNLEGPGMEYIKTYINKIIGTEDIKIEYVQDGDLYDYITRKGDIDK